MPASELPVDCVAYCACRDAYNAILSLKDAQWELDTLEKLPEGVQPQISVEELLLCEKIIREDKRVQKLAADVGEGGQVRLQPSYRDI